jgi:hypothetical protein
MFKLPSKPLKKKELPSKPNVGIRNWEVDYDVRSSM